MKKENRPHKASSLHLDFQRVTVLRGDKEALRDVSIKIKTGENVVILGPNGSGKSTLIKTITRELYPSHGSVKIFGEERWDIFELRKKLGIISPDLQQACEHDVSGESPTGLDTVISGYFSSIGLWKNNLVTQEMKNKAREAIRFLGVGHIQDQPFSEMSAGEARRILVARALVHNPQALILDEPTNSMDLKALYAFRKILRKIVRARKSIIMVTHNLADIIPEIKRAILLKDGQVAMDGPVEKVMTSKNLSDLFETRLELLVKDGHYVLW